MHRSIIILILAALLAGCAAPIAESTPPPVVETEAPLPSETSPAVEPPTSEPSATEEQSTPTEPPLPTEPVASPTAGSKGLDSWVAYISPDQNLWITNPATAESIALTDDAVPFQPNVEQETVTYCCAEFSSDGSLLAYRREDGRPTESAYEYNYSLWVYDMSSGESRQLVDGLVMSYAWKPGEHLIAYGPEIDFDYFTDLTNRAQFANGIWAVDADGGEPYELVAPERGFALTFPVWSPDGRFLSFEEIQYMEGRGLFAYYDLAAQEYIAWEEVIGSYAWSPDGELIAYDTMAYVPLGTERIFLRSRTGQGASQFSPDIEEGYASLPVFSPQGDRLAYLAAFGSPESTQYTLMVQDIDAAEPRELGEFEGVYEIAWSSDGSSLVFATGPFETRDVVQVQVEDGSVITLAQGSMPAVQP